MRISNLSSGCINSSRMEVEDDRILLVLWMRKEQRERRTEEKESHNCGDGRGKMDSPIRGNDEGTILLTTSLQWRQQWNSMVW